MDIHSFVLALLAACTIAADPGDTTVAPTVTGKQACQGHSYDKATCEAVGCCFWNALLGCRANDGDAQCDSGPEPEPTTTVTQEAQTDPPETTTTKDSSASALWGFIIALWILFGILTCCWLLSLCGLGPLACMCGPKKKKKTKRAMAVSQPSPEPVALPVVEEHREFTPMAPPLIEPSMMMPTTATQEIGGFGTQALPANGGGGFGTQALPGMF